MSSLLPLAALLAASLLLPIEAAARVRAPVVAPIRADEAADDAAGEALTLFKKALPKYRMGEVARALRVFDETYDQLSPGVAKKVDQAVVKLFKTRPRNPKEPNEDTREELVESYQLAIGLVFERPQGADVLTDALAQKHVRGWSEMEATLLEALGYRRDPQSLAMLIEYLGSDAGVVAGAAANGLGALSEEPLPTRRAAVDALVQAWQEAAEMARREVDRKKDTTQARDRLEQVEGPFELNLRELTRKRFDGVDAWADWFRAEGGGTDW